MKECYRISTDPLACEENQIRGEKYRITLLTECLVRLEYDEAGQFEDGSTQMVLNRNFPPVPHTLSRTADGIIVRTARMEIQYNEKAFSPNGLEKNVGSSSPRDKRMSVFESAMSLPQCISTLPHPRSRNSPTAEITS